MNKVVLIGRMTKDAQLGYTSNTQKAVAKFTLAVDRINEGADFINCTAFGKTSAFICKYFKKGDGITIAGHMQSDKKDDKTYWNLIVDRPYFEHAKRDDAAADDVPDGYSRITDDQIPF